MTAEQHYKGWYAENQGLDLTYDNLTSLDRDIVNVMSSFAKQESIEFAKWIDKQGYTQLNDGEWASYNTGPKTPEELYEKYQQSKTQ